MSRISAESTPTVLLTDRAWSDDGVERIKVVGLAPVHGGPDASPAEAVERLVADHHRGNHDVLGACISRGHRGVARVERGGTNGRCVGQHRHRRGHRAERACRNVPDYCVEPVSDHAVGLVLAWTRGIARADREISEPGAGNPRARGCGSRRR
jgi:D-3-phosphoglycerate dehydrogenase